MKLAPVLILYFCFALLAIAEEPHVAARDKAKRQLAIRAAAQKIVDALQTPPAVSEEDARRLVAELGARMQQDVKAHSDPDASRTLCLKQLVDQRRRSLDAWIDDAVARAREHTAFPLRKEDVLGLLGDDWGRRVTTEADAFAARHIDNTFGQARKQSVALQRDELKGRIRMPSEQDLDARLTGLADSSGHQPPQPSDLDKLKDWLTSFAAPPDRPLFKEVQHSAHEASQRVIDQVKKQYSQQLTALRKAAKALPDAAIDADSIRGALLAAADTAIKALQVEEKHNPPDERATIYGPLTVIRKEADHMAGAMEEERLDAVIRSQQSIPLDPAAIETSVRSDLKAHRSAKTSRQLLLTRYTAELKPWFTERLVARAGRVGDAAFTAKITTLLDQSKRLAKSLNDHVGHQLDRVLPDIRKRVGADQLRGLFGDLPATIEALTPEGVEAIWTASRCDAAKKFDVAWQSLSDAGLLLADTDKGRLVDEARQQVIDTCNRLIPSGCRAMREQGNQLALLEKEWTAKLQKDVEAGRAIEKITTDWTRELDRRWRTYAEKEKLPYPDLFARTLDLLDKTVRKLFESRQAEMEEQAADAAEEQAEPTPPEEETVEEPPTPEETPEDATSVTIKEMLETLDFVLFFRDIDGKSEAVLLSGDGKSRRLAFDAGNVQNAVDAVYAYIIPAIEEAARSKAAKRNEGSALVNIIQSFRSLDLKIAVLVGSEQVRHMTSILLRNRVEVFVEDWNANPDNPSLELEWEDNLEVAQ